MLVLIRSPSPAKIVTKVSSVSLGPATLPYNVPPNTTSSDNIPAPTTNHGSSPSIATPSLAANSGDLLVPHSSSSEQMYALPKLHLFPPSGGL